MVWYEMPLGEGTLFASRPCIGVGVSMSVSVVNGQCEKRGAEIAQPLANDNHPKIEKGKV